MKKYLVLYYSKTGNSKFLAEKLSTELGCDLIRITPWTNNIMLLILISSLKTGIATNIKMEDLKEYDEVIIFGPIWGGLLIAPLRNVLNKCYRVSKNIHFVLTCETSDEEKNLKYGYTKVLKEAESIGGEFIQSTNAFSTTLVKNSDKSWSPRRSEKIKITEENYGGELKSRFENFVSKFYVPF